MAYRLAAAAAATTRAHAAGLRFPAPAGTDRALTARCTADRAARSARCCLLTAPQVPHTRQDDTHERTTLDNHNMKPPHTQAGATAPEGTSFISAMSNRLKVSESSTLCRPSTSPVAMTSSTSTRMIVRQSGRPARRWKPAPRPSTRDRDGIMAVSRPRGASASFVSSSRGNGADDGAGALAVEPSREAGAAARRCGTGTRKPSKGSAGRPM